MSKTLLQLMLESNVVWHKGILYAVQSWPAKDIPVEDPGVCLYQECPSLAPDGTWISSNGPSGFSSVGGWAEDRLTKVISKEEYQAAGGWMEYDWNGSPVPKGTTVIVAWSDGDTTQFTQGDTSETWSFKNPEILRYRIAVEEAKASQPEPEATAQANKEDGGTCVILTGSGTIHSDARVLYNSGKTVVWEKDGEEYTATFGYVTINPSREEIASAVLFGLCDETVDPPIMRELMNKMGWK